ncbi:acetyl esterase/lipase [Rudaeicoccus suwonensis]|uniref:Acetyl esterase/lipase n=2 Tax=Rudaeicoccus suwonensis TaxID=657409 RepID=A0A561E0T4_9MICO|nr:acetyl esterase/lipase [Rudaeicoccus suwonensis]
MPVPAVRVRHPRTSRRSAVLAGSLRATAKPVVTLWSYAPSLVRLSRVMDTGADRLRLPEGTAVDRVQLGPCDGEWIRAPRCRPDAAVLYLHGGALISCSLASHRRLVAATSRVCRAPALNVGFRMLPVVTLDDMVSDCMAGYRWLLDRGYSGEQISIVGDSAGGLLTFLLVLALRDEGLPMPAAIASMSPLLDLGIERKQASPYHERCDVFTVRACRTLNTFVAAVDRAHERYGARLSPIDCDLHGLPPVLLQVGSHEILRPEIEEMADRLAEADVPVTLDIWKGQVHVFQAAASWLPEAQQALRTLGQFVLHPPPVG